MGRVINTKVCNSVIVKPQGKEPMKRPTSRQPIEWRIILKWILKK
jgi:hypothetical protein